MESAKAPRTVATAWALALVLAVIVQSIDGIRVYEGTNFEAPKGKSHKHTGLAKKSLYITKRSWSPPNEDGVKAPAKLDRRGEAKLKDLPGKKKSDQVEYPALYKIKFTEKNYMQYVKYIKEIPRLEEYTLCLWYKPRNLSHNHVLYSYSLNKKENLLKFWLNAADSTLRMAIRDTVVYRVPVNIRTSKWHHVCQSWHGISGEWQVFLDGKRVGAGLLELYKETYIPEGGEFILGQDLLGTEKVSTDGMDGYVFGFNLVDEAVPGDQGAFINSQYKPNVQGFVPPFKKLPPMKKTYQQIKAYISRLPMNPGEPGKGIEPKPGEELNSIKRTRESTGPKRVKVNPRVRYPPARKVVVYNRNDRKLPLDEDTDVNTTVSPVLESEKRAVGVEGRTPLGGQSAANRHGDVSDVTDSTERPSTGVGSQTYDENYSIHSYRLGKQEKKTSNYEIYESVEDDLVKPVEFSFRNNDKQGNNSTNSRGSTRGTASPSGLSLSFERKARENFDLFTAREANKVYTLSNAVKDTRKQRFHFESFPNEGENFQKSSKPQKPRAFQKVTQNKAGAKASAAEVTTTTTTTRQVERKPSDPIPVYEAEVVLLRQKRDSGVIGEQLTDGFRPLPNIPDSFIDIFTRNGSKAEIQKNLNRFFPENVTAAAGPPTGHSGPSQVPAESRGSPSRVAPPPSTTPYSDSQVRRSDDPAKLSGQTRTTRQRYTMSQVPADTRPAEFPRPVDDPEPSRKRFAERSFAAETGTDSQQFQVTSGTELIMRAYGLCTADRGSPIRDKHHLVISWAETPMRIFGGADVEIARNECGNF